MRLKRLYPSLLSKDLVATAAFYVGRLGFERSGAYPTLTAPTWIELRRDDVVLQFHDEAPRGMPDTPVLSGTLYIATDDVESFAEALRAKGVELLWGPEVMDYGDLEFGLRDPNGYVLAFTEPA